MTGRSSSVPKITIGAGLLAAALGPFPMDGTSSSSSKATADGTSSAMALQGRVSQSPGGSQTACASISFTIDEEWSDNRHMAELMSLIMKKATAVLSSKDEKRLETLQRMRRESLPPATTYDEFIRERERDAELKRLTDALFAYERKYGANANG